MKVITKIKKMQSLSEKLRLERKKIGFVPTMGYLHNGHLSLVKRIKQLCDTVVMSIFVNPTQFGPNEDFKDYPRNFKRDKKLAQQSGVDIIFYPTIKEMYKNDFLTSVKVKKITEIMCGLSRPTHFEGVTTVVAKLFNIIKPHIAIFGQKDAQQSAVIKKMAKDLNFDIKIIISPIIREKDGLAISSRNTYLSRDERKDALVLYESLLYAKKLIRNGETSPKFIIKKMKELISPKKRVKLDYISITDPNTLENVKEIKEKVLIALAAYIGKTRLIDNIIV
jgi:pantoate--beta-alanine ligase